MNQPRYLIATDFDGTLFKTSEPSPKGMTVLKAYVQGLDDIFGKGIGEWFFSINGFHGEGPSQIIETLLRTRKDHLIENAIRFYREQNGNFPRVIPESQGGIIEWNNEKPEVSLSSTLIVRKLDYLLKEIGTTDQNGNPWPLPCEGALDFLQILRSLKEENAPIDLAVISSGHESFIKKTLDVWNIPPPDILVTEDSVRTRAFPQEAERKFKPGVLPVALAHFQWLKDQGIPVSRENGYDTRTRIMHIGDTPAKDLAMAERARIQANFLFPLKTWTSIAKALTQNRSLLDGRPIGEVLKPVSVRVESFTGGRSERR